MQEHYSAVAVRQRPADDSLPDSLRSRFLVPLVGFHVPAHMPIAQRSERSDEGRIVGACTEWAPEPRVRVNAGLAPNNCLRIGQVFTKPVLGEERHPRVVVRVAADQVAPSDPARQVWISLHPSALEKEGGVKLETLQHVQDLDGPGRPRRAIRVLGVEGEGDPELAGYFSTPVITTPRMKTRWKTRNRSTGTMSVMSVPAWMRPGSCAERLALKTASPTASGWRSGLVDK